MARPHAREGSPDHDQAADPAKLLKRLKTTDTPPELHDPGAHFATGLFDHNNIAQLNIAYRDNKPFKHALIDKLFQDDLLVKVKDECLTHLSFTEKETDIYKINQTGDLASLNYLKPEQLSLFPNLLALRDALYSPIFREFLRTVTGCGPLSGIKQDMSVSTYARGCHLLNHDDVIGTRRISYILYMPLPPQQLWQKDWGGALELYPVSRSRDGVLEPDPIPSKSILPSWNQFILFEVQPGFSFHSVEEVVIGGHGDPRERLSISGWFHAPQQGEEGYAPEQPSEYKSSREQLQATKTVFKPYQSVLEEEHLVSATSLPEDHIAFLSEFLNPVYLQPRTMQALASRFAEESSLELHHFLENALAEALEPRLRELDARDGLGPNRPATIPPHTAGVSSTPPSHVPPTAAITTTTTTTTTTASSSLVSGGPVSSTSSSSGKQQSNWIIRGPPHKWRYCVLAPRPGNKPVEAVIPRAAQPSSDEILRSLQDELFPSEAFRAWLSIVGGLMPLGCLAEARRFRPGLDYTLATSEEKEARLDVVLGLTPEPVRSKDASSRKRIAPRGWEAAEWGGWECYMAPHNEEDDPTVYRSGKSKKSAPTKAALKMNGSSQKGMDGHKSSGPSEQHKKTDSDVEMDGEDDRDGEVEEEEEDSTLLTVHPGFNRLLLVLRDERVMRFVKYVSAAAEGSRWDVCGEYEVGMLEEAEDQGSNSEVTS